MRHTIFGAVIGGVLVIPMTIYFMNADFLQAILCGCAGTVFSIAVMMTRRSNQTQKEA